MLHEGNTNACSCRAGLHAMQKQRRIIYRPGVALLLQSTVPGCCHLGKRLHTDAACRAGKGPSSRLRDFCSLHTHGFCQHTEKCTCTYMGACTGSARSGSNVVTHSSSACTCTGTCTGSAHVNSNVVPHPLEPGADWCLHVLRSSQLIVIPAAMFGSRPSWECSIIP